MLRAIATAIVSALKSVGRMFGRIAAAPFAAIDAMIGGGGAVPPPIELPDPIETTTNDHTEVYRQIADSIMRWACASVIDDRPAPLPPGLPLAIREWLPGLTRDECEAIVESEMTDVLAHSKGVLPIVGVRSVQPLPAVSEWSARESEPTSENEAGSPPISVPGLCGAR